MKITPEKIVPLSVVITSVLILLGGIFALRGVSENELSLENYTTLSKQVYEIETIKTRWSHEASQSDFAYLTAHPNLVKNERQGGSITLEFNHLSSSEFNTIANKLLNSMLIIKKLTLQRSSASRGIIIVELES
ncbi:MAG TPA: hypothetical protein VFX68_07140 [Sulfuricurvum sp.]|nr:hypothetical protein [Sulfuricurvum sp.]